jgi:hypothetical protein
MFIPNIAWDILTLSNIYFSEIPVKFGMLSFCLVILVRFNPFLQVNLSLFSSRRTQPQGRVFYRTAIFCPTLRK